VLCKTKGIVIHYIKYSESSIIVKIYTEELGLQTYIVNGIRSAKSKHKIALFQPLTLLDMVVYYQKNIQKIFRISELKCSYPFQSIPFDYQKSTMALFLTEILGKVLQEESPNPDLYYFLENAMISFDKIGNQHNHFHLQFLLKLPLYLGIGIENAAEFFLQLSEYKPEVDSMKHLADMKKYIDLLIQHPYEDINFGMPPFLKSQLIDLILDFYRLHISNFSEIKSLVVLREMMK
jgi:DNA repair protein RecO (recombination protein O)